MKEIGGWWRIWIAITAVLCSAGILSAMSDKDYVEQYNGATVPLALACLPSTREQVETLASQYASASYESDRASEMIIVEDELVQVGPGDSRYRTPEQRGIKKPRTAYELRCTSLYGIASKLISALLISVSIALIGLAIRWIYRGFKKNVN